MSDIVIRGMEMPEPGNAATITVYWDGVWCAHYGNEPHGKAVPLPEKHGRLVVRDKQYMEAALEAVIAERRRQISLYGDQTGLPLMSWPGILGEEFGELCEAIGETVSPPPSRHHPERGGLDNIYREACHVAAVAVQVMQAVRSKQEAGRRREAGPRPSGPRN